MKRVDHRPSAVNRVESGHSIALRTWSRCSWSNATWRDMRCVDIARREVHCPGPACRRQITRSASSDGCGVTWWGNAVRPSP